MPTSRIAKEIAHSGRPPQDRKCAVIVVDPYGEVILLRSGKSAVKLFLNSCSTEPSLDVVKTGWHLPEDFTELDAWIAYAMFCASRYLAVGPNENGASGLGADYARLAVATGYGDRWPSA